MLAALLKQHLKIHFQPEILYLQGVDTFVQRTKKLLTLFSQPG